MQLRVRRRTKRPQWYRVKEVLNLNQAVGRRKEGTAADRAANPVDERTAQTVQAGDGRNLRLVLMQLPKSFLFQTSRRQSLLQHHRQHAGHSTAPEFTRINRHEETRGEILLANVTMAATKRNAGLTSAVPRATLNDEELKMYFEDRQGSNAKQVIN
ncbi:Uncharacterized protein DBV15_00379 [Temnothorax longispinosus]|uniref:Uncharacterized protein n=1 Tax=Temnothorax longispinosus TaxID=300112 RepID=A0A4S2JQ14_9HYME|nr:Uncharacterized protein DBV15_00379 [Temnothorax longispinosus]